MVVWETGVFCAVHWRRCGFRLTFDSPSATRADREARPPSLRGHGCGTALFQGFGNRIVDTFEPDELQLLTRALRNFIKIPAVTCRQHHPGKAGRGGGDDFFLDAANGQHQTPQRYLAGHGCVTPNRAVGEQRGKRREHRDAGARSILRRGARGHMDVDVASFKYRGVDSELSGAALRQGQRRLRAFTHDVAELAGEDQCAFSGNPARLDKENVAADRRPCQPGGDTGNTGAHRDLIFEAGRAENRGEVAGGDGDLVRAALGDLYRGMAECPADFPLKRTNAGLAGVTPDSESERFNFNLGLLGLQAVCFKLATNQVAPPDLKLFILRVAGQADDLHAVLQRSRYRIQHVGGGDEHDARKVEGHAEVIIAKRRVLFRIENFEHRGRGIALNSATHLVDLVEHHHAIARARFLDGLNDIAGQGADIGPPVAADFRFIMHAAKTDADERPIHRACDRLAQRSLADAGGPDEAEDRRLALRRQFSHRQIFDDPALDLLQTVMILVQDAARLRDVDGLFRRQTPWQLDQPIEIAAYHAGLRGCLRHSLVAPYLLACLAFRLGRHLRLGDRLVQLRHFLRLSVAFSQLALNGRHLLAKDGLALAFIEYGLCLLPNLVGQSKDFQSFGEIT